MPGSRLDLEDGPTKYLDRPTNDGKHGDGADEPTDSGPQSTATDSPERSTPGRPHGTSRQQKHDDQNLQSDSDSLDKGSASGSAHPPARPPGAK
jgi:hypothetical protein